GFDEPRAVGAPHEIALYVSVDPQGWQIPRARSVDKEEAEEAAWQDRVRHTALREFHQIPRVPLGELWWFQAAGKVDGQLALESDLTLVGNAAKAAPVIPAWLG